MAEFKGRIKKNFGMGSIIASAFFLFNPDIAIIDLIPDVFGYLLLMLGISQLSEVNEKIAEAKRLFGKAAICNAVKTGLIVVLFGLVTPREMPVSMLLFTFVMNIFDLIYVVPGYLNFFGGLIFLGERLDGNYVLGRKQYKPRKRTYDLSLSAEKEKKISEKEDRYEKKRLKKNARALSNTEKFCRITIVFVLFKAVMPVLPEFTSLLDDEFSNSLVNYYDFIFLYRTIAVFLLFAIGLVWLFFALKYYIGIMRDRVFISALKEKYQNEVIPNKIYFAKKFANKATAMFTVTVFFMVNLYFDEVNIIPDAIFAVLLAISAFSIRRYVEQWKFAFISAVAVGLSSVIIEYLRAKFNQNYIKEQIMRNPDAYEAWFRIVIVSAVLAVATAFAVISMILIARSVAKKYTGFFSKGTDAFDPERATDELHAELVRPLIVTGAFGILASIRVPAYFLAMAIRFEAVWFIDIVVSLVFAICFVQNIWDIAANINYRHFVGDE